MTTKHPKRPRDPAQLAKRIVDIATGEVEDREPMKLTKKQAGVIGGKKRAIDLSPKRRSEIASKAARKRWGVKS
jgi:hypothetical protein